MLILRLCSVLNVAFNHFTPAWVLPWALLLATDSAALVRAATPSSEEVADAFDCASALNNKVSRRDVSLDEALVGLSKEGATAEKEAQAAALEQDARLHQQLASEVEEEKINEAKRHQQLMRNAEEKSKKGIDTLEQEIRKVEAEEDKAKEQLAEEESALQKLKHLTETLPHSNAETRATTAGAGKVEAVQSRLAYAGKADDLKKLPLANEGTNVLQEAGGVGVTVIESQHGEEIVKKAKQTLEECLKQKASFLRDKKFVHHPGAVWQS